MNVGFYCKNNNCGYTGPKPYQHEENVESIMDLNNIAAIFCPHCNEKLVREEQEKAVNQ